MVRWGRGAWEVGPMRWLGQRAVVDRARGGYGGGPEGRPEERPVRADAAEVAHTPDELRSAIRQIGVREDLGVGGHHPGASNG